MVTIGAGLVGARQCRFPGNVGGLHMGEGT